MHILIVLIRCHWSEVKGRGFHDISNGGRHSQTGASTRQRRGKSHTKDEERWAGCSGRSGEDTLAPSSLLPGVDPEILTSWVGGGAPVRKTKGFQLVINFFRVKNANVCCGIGYKMNYM